MPSSGCKWLAWSGLASISTILAAGRADDEIGRAGARRVGHRPRRLVESLGVQHLPAADMERRAIGIAAVMARGQAVLDQADPAFVDAHLAAGDPGLGEADEARLVLAPGAQHEGAPMHAFEPVPVLAEPGVAIGGYLRLEAEGGAAVGADLQQLSRGTWLRRLLSEQGESELIARIEQRDGRFALAAAFGNSAHLLGIGRGSGRRSPRATVAASAKACVAAEARGREPAQIGLDIVGDFPRQTAGHARARRHGRRRRPSAAECSSCVTPGHLARFPPKWNHFGDKKSRQLNMLEHVLVGKVLTLCRNML